MKRAALLLITLLLTLSASAALANSWNLTGPLLNYVSKTHDFDDYTAYVSMDDSRKGADTVAAIMRGYGHHLLLVGHKNEAGEWDVIESFTALDNNVPCQLYQFTCEGDDLILSCYSYGETFVFRCYEGGLESGMEDGFWLTEATIADNERLTMDAEHRYFITFGGETLRWYTDGPINLRDFNIYLFPRSADEVRAMNTARALSHGWMDSAPIPQNLKKNLKLPVYSAPDETSFRAAGGKASVSLNGTFLPLGKDDDGWVLLEYAINEHTHRVGWAKDDALTP